MSKRYVFTTRSRWKRPRSTKRWYRCPCGRWWGINKSCMCRCGAPPKATRAEALAGQKETIRRLEAIGWTAESARGYVYRDEPLVERSWP